MSNSKDSGLLANEIYALANILKVYCENYASDNHQIACIEFLAEHICNCADDLAKTY